MLIEHYDGALAIERSWRQGLTPDPLLTVSVWSDQHRILSSKASAEPGRWRTRRTPYLKAITEERNNAEKKAFAGQKPIARIDGYRSNYLVIKEK